MTVFKAAFPTKGGRRKAKGRTVSSALLKCRVARYPCPCCGYLTLDQPQRGNTRFVRCVFGRTTPFSCNPDYQGGDNVPSLNEGAGRSRQ